MTRVGVAIGVLSQPGWLVACAQEGSTKTTNGGPASAGTLRIVTPMFTPQPRLPFQGGTTASSVIRGSLYETLLHFEPKTFRRDIPSLATSWTHSQDLRIWTFHLRQGVQFHRDAGEMTSADVQFSFGLISRPDSISPDKQFFKDTVKSVSTPDKYTVVFELNYPNVFTDHLTDFDSSLLITSKSYFERVGLDQATQRPVGTGPYILDSYQAGVSYNYTRSSNYWGDKPQFSGLQIRFVTDDNTRLALVGNGEADVTDLPRNLIDTAQKQHGLHTKATSISTVSCVLWLGSLFANNQGGNPWKDARVRRALNLGIDRQAIIKGIFKGFAEPIAFNIVGPKTPGYDYIQRKPYPYDSATAKTLLADAGYGNGLELTLRPYTLSGIPEFDTVTQAIAAGWSNIGVKAHIQPTTGADLGSKTRTALDYLYPARTPYNLFAPEGFLSIFYTSKGSWGGVGQPDQARIDALYEQLNNTSDTTERAKIVGKIAQMVYDNYWVIPLVAVKSVVAWNPKTVSDWNGTLAFGFDGLTTVTAASRVGPRS